MLPNIRKILASQKSSLMKTRQLGVLQNPDNLNSQTEDNKRRAFESVAAKQLPAAISSPAFVRDVNPSPLPEDDPVAIIDRLHKEGKYYIFVSPNHNSGEDPIPNPGFASEPLLVSSINDAYKEAKRLRAALTEPFERIVIYVLGGVYREYIVMDTDRIDIVGLGHGDSRPLLIVTLPEITEGLPPITAGVTIDPKGIIGPGEGCVLEGFRIQSPQNLIGIFVPQGPSGFKEESNICIYNVSVESIGISLYSYRRIIVSESEFTVLPIDEISLFVPAVKIQATTGHNGATYFHHCKMYSATDTDGFNSGVAMEVTAAGIGPNGVYLPSSLTKHSWVEVYGDSKVYGQVHVKGWNFAFLNSFGKLTKKSTGESYGPNNAFFHLHGIANTNIMLLDDTVTPAEIHVDNSRIFADALAKFYDSRAGDYQGVTGHVAFIDSKHVTEKGVVPNPSACHPWQFAAVMGIIAPIGASVTSCHHWTIFTEIQEYTPPTPINYHNLNGSYTNVQGSFVLPMWNPYMNDFRSR